MTKLQDGPLARQGAKAQAMRQREQERLGRFLNAKQRTLGIDKEYLDEQVREKNRLEDLKKEEGVREAMEQEELLKYLEDQEAIQQQVKLQELEEINAVLAVQAAQPKNNALAKDDPLDLENCGPSSLQKFDGEDHDHEERKRLQQDQLRYWCSQGIREREGKMGENQREEEDYAKYVLEEDIIRAETERQQQFHREEMNAKVSEENRMLAKERQKILKQEREEEKKLEDLETHHIYTSPFFCEETDYTKSAISEHRVRPDHFKGFSPEKTKSITDENALVVAEKEALCKDEDEREREWASRQNDMVAEMAEMERIKQKVMEDDNKIQEETLKIQREELKQKQEEMKRDRFGAVDYGFFQKFGTSCR